MLGLVCCETPPGLKLLWLVPALPLAGAVINLFFGKRLRGTAGVLATAVVGASLLVAVLAWQGLLQQPADARVFVLRLWSWIRAGDLGVGTYLRLDPISVTMILVVTGVGFLIHVYSIGYMEGDPRFGRYFAYLNLFVFFMLVLVLADNYLVLYVGWEGVGLCSYLLIGFWYQQTWPANGAKKAFVTTRIGDSAFLIGIILIFLQFGTLRFSNVLGPGAAQTLTKGWATAIAVLLFAGAVGKSAQFPLHVWLLDAMAGPTPVSALIHAATMVTAGVYVVVRSHVLFETSGAALTLVLVIGLFTAVYAACSAIGQNDIKQVLGWSTISQLGYMFVAAGMGNYGAAMLLLVAHAFYKSLLFLSAGSVMHGMHDETDMRKMGGLRRAMPYTTVLFGIGALSLAGIPPLGGFFAKDTIVNYALQTSRVSVYVIGLVAAVLSSIYITRPFFMTFLGRFRGEGHPHESPPVMVVPLVALAVGAVLIGLVLGISATGTLFQFLAPVTGTAEETAANVPPEWVLFLLGTGAAVLGLATAFGVWGWRFDWQDFARRHPAFQRTLERGFYVNDLYAVTVERPLKGGAQLLLWFDARVIDGTVNGTGRLFRGLAGVGRRIQTGVVRNYALGFLLGVVGLLVFLLVRF